MELKARKKKCARHEAITSEEEVEKVDNDPAPEPPMEQVNDVSNEQPEGPELSKELDEVSTPDHITQRINQLTE